MPVLVVTPTITATTALLSNAVVQGLTLTFAAPRPTVTLGVEPGAAMQVVVAARRPSLKLRGVSTAVGAITAPHPSLTLSMVSGVNMPVAVAVKRPVLRADGLTSAILEASFVPLRPTVKLAGIPGAGGSVTFKVRRPKLGLSLVAGKAMTVTVSSPRPVLILSAGDNATFPVVITAGRPTFVFAGTVPLNELFQTVVMNTQTKGHLIYENFGFLSLVKHQGKYYGCNAEGIFELSGNTDNGVAIDASILTGISNLGVDAQKYVPEAHLKVRCEGQLTVTTTIDELRQPEPYPVTFRAGQQGLHSKRCKMAKGVKGTSWQVEIRNVDGADFDLEKMELITVPTRRS